jgi:hypothetical protein
MGIQTDIVIADLEDAQAVADATDPTSKWEGFTFNGFDHVHLCTLLSLLKAGSPNAEFERYLEIIEPVSTRTDVGPVVVAVRPEQVAELTAVASLDGAAFESLPALVSIYLCWRWRRRLRSVFIGPALLLVTLLLLVASGYSLWYEHRPLPAAERRELAPGITFIRELRASPRPIVIHVVAIDLDRPGLEFLVTPAEPNQGRQLRARTTSQFVKEFPVTVAINASFFYPWHSNCPLDYYPHAGDPCDVCGKCVSRGAAYSSLEHGFNLLSISKDNRVTIGAEAEGARNAVSGREILLQDGEPVAGLSDAPPLMPQTAVGVDQTGRNSSPSSWATPAPKSSVLAGEPKRASRLCLRRIAGARRSRALIAVRPVTGRAPTPCGRRGAVPSDCRRPTCG